MIQSTLSVVSVTEPETKTPVVSFTRIANSTRNIRSVSEWLTEIVNDPIEDKTVDLQSEQQKPKFVFNKETASSVEESIAESIPTLADKESSSPYSIPEEEPVDESYSAAVQVDQKDEQYESDFESVSSGFQEKTERSTKTSDGSSTMSIGGGATNMLDQEAQTDIVSRLDATVMTEERLSKSQLRRVLLGQIGFIRNQFEEQKMIYQDLMRNLN